MVEKRNTKGSQAPRKIGMNDQEKEEQESTELDEIHLSAGPATTQDNLANDSSEEEKESSRKAPFKRPMTRDAVQAYSRWLHRNTPPNRYLKVKVPYRTIFMAFIFFVVGTIMLYLGFCDMSE